ncbi:MAG: hypothetical protein L0Z62_10075 [Gemmataceae bacterium]|nr:hypothetical protein [Gemmataceae bacterium]
MGRLCLVVCLATGVFLSGCQSVQQGPVRVARAQLGEPTDAPSAPSEDFTPRTFTQTTWLDRHPVLQCALYVVGVAAGVVLVTGLVILLLWAQSEDDSTTSSSLSSAVPAESG